MSRRRAATSPHGRGSRERASARARRRAVLVALFLLAAGLLATPAAAAPSPAGGGGVGGAGSAGSAGGASGTGTQATTAIEIMGQPTWVHPGEPYAVDVGVTGAPAGAALDMVVHDRLESRRAFRDTLAGELGGAEHTVPPQPLAGLPTASPGAVTIGFTPGADGAGLEGAGVYPVEVRLLAADGSVLASALTYLSHLKEETPEFPPLEVAVLVDMAAPPALQPDGTYVLPPGAGERARERVQVLADTAGVPLMPAPLPETLAALAAGEPADVAAVEQLRTLAGGTRVLARPFVDVDLGALQAAGLLVEANAQADGGANVVRQQLGVEPAGRVWLSGETLGADSARIAEDLGFDRAVVPPSAVELGDGGGDDAVVPTGPVRLGDDGPVAMVTDTALADHLTSAEGMVAAHRFLAELTIMWLESPSIQRGVVVHLPADAEIDPGVVALALGALADGQAVRAVTVHQLFQDVPPPADGPASVATAPHETGGGLSAVAPALRSARSRVAGLGALLDDPTVSASLEQSLLLSTGSGTPDDQRAAYVGRADTALDSVSGAVTLPSEFRITLTSRSSTIPVTLSNLSDQELNVRVELESDQLEFPEGDVLTATLVPESTTRIEVPVRTRTSGAFTLDITVTSPDGSIVLDRSTFDVRSTAISGVGIFLSIGAGLFLAIWWARHWRDTRRSRRLVPAPTDGPPSPTDGDPVPPPVTTAGEPYRPAHMARPRTPSS